ncbi:hypothetical protein [Sporolituus thermophilus]|uniref:Uncharacterized protein n=1 Tax=Sporolituus thermophilus DSM 23256 TaxID=1123285 RepID=A0A1G7KXU0_9FIRM|nr:hypothetical protein [Sporolituus thermophilus]SDF41906.1 hypothetical protein SAMN05660235_01506 [Sporolituus thermophilus DSM 23256]
MKYFIKQMNAEGSDTFNTKEDMLVALRELVYDGGWYDLSVSDENGTEYEIDIAVYPK